MPLPTAALPREDVTLLPSPLIEFIRLGLEHSAIPLTSGQPHPSCYPLEELATAASEAIRSEGDRYLRYGASRGLGKLRSLVDRELTERHIFPPDLSPDSLVLTVGAQGAFDLLCQAVLRPGEAVALDAPCYPDTWCTVVRRGGKVIPIPVDAEGMDVDALEGALHQGVRPRLVYTIPTYQNPTGCSLSPERSSRLVALAERFDFLVVLDDPYRLLPLDEPLRSGEEFFPWKGWNSGRVVALGSFSKILAPGLRVGWAHAAPELADALATLQEMSHISLPALDALAVASFLEHHGLEGQIQRVRTFLQGQRAALIDAMAEARLEELGCGTMASAGGCFLGLVLPAGREASPVARTLAVDFGVATVPERAFWPPHGEGAPDRFLRLSFSWATPEEFHRSAQAFRQVLTTP